VITPMRCCGERRRTTAKGSWKADRSEQNSLFPMHFDLSKTMDSFWLDVSAVIIVPPCHQSRSLRLQMFLQLRGCMLKQRANCRLLRQAIQQTEIVDHSVVTYCRNFDSSLIEFAAISFAPKVHIEVVRMRQFQDLPLHRQREVEGTNRGRSLEVHWGWTQERCLPAYFFTNVMRVPNFLPTPLEKAPKLSLARLFWKSLGLK
jgi:hypothetical protein